MARKPATDDTASQQDSDTYNMSGHDAPADPNALPSVVEFDSDITDAPPPDPLPKGEYPAQVNTCTIKMSQKGNRYVEMMLFISPDAYPIDFTEGNPGGINVAYRRVDASINPVTGKLTPRAAYQMGRMMRTLGMEGGRRIDVADWSGRDCRVVIDHRPGQNDPNEMFPEVVAVKSA